MGIFGKSRANTTNQISQPVLTFSDATPRKDLHALRPVESPRQYTAQAERAVDGKGRQNITQGFDFTVTEPPEGVSALDGSSLNDHCVEAHAIGIALGSPSMAPPPEYPPPAPEKQEMTTATGSLRRKPSKWKKFGGLLKARQPETKRTHEGYYQLDIQNVREGNGSSSQHLITQTEVLAAPNQKRNVQASPPNYQRGGDKVDHHHANEDGSLLKVDIPTVQMERYSIMFRSVLGEKPPSNLLARRSKALDQLHVHGKESKLPQTHIPQRRGTTPGPGRSPAFTTSPGASGGKRSPIRSNTFPTAAASLSRKSHKSHLAVPDLTPALSPGTSFDYSSTEPSPSSFGSPVTIKLAHVDGGRRPEPVWEMATRLPSSVSPQTSYSDPSARSTPVTTPPVGTDVTSSTTKLLPLPPPRKASLPPLPMDITRKPKTMDINRKNKVQNEEDDDDDQFLLEHLSVAQRPRQLSRAQTMPLPLKIKKNTSQMRAKAASAATPTTDFDDSPLAKTVEISIARSVSVSRPRQTLVPLGATPQSFHNESERFGEHQKLLPTLVDVGGGGGGHGGVHRHQKSQDIVIERI